MDEMRELSRVPDEEHGRIYALIRVTHEGRETKARLLFITRSSIPFLVRNLCTWRSKDEGKLPRRTAQSLLHSETAGVAGFVRGAGLATHSTEPNCKKEASISAVKAARAREKTHSLWES